MELLRLGSSLPGGGSYVRDLSCASCVSRLLFPYMVSFMSLLVNLCQVCVISECVFKSCLLSSISSGSTRYSRCVYLALSTLDVVIKTIILKYLLVCVFLVSPCCVHRNNFSVVFFYSLDLGGNNGV